MDLHEKNGRASLLDSGEDFEMLDDENNDEDPPPLEDAGGGARDEEAPGGGGGGGGGSDQPEEEWMDILSNGLLKKKVLQEGEGRDTRPQRGQNVRIRLETSLKGGPRVEEEQEVTFTLGDGDVLQVLDLTVQLMEKNEKVLIHTDARYAYGALGSDDPKVPPNTDLSLEVKLLEVTDAPDLELLPPAEKISLAHVKRERGNFYYQRGDFAFAVNSYGVALKVIDSSSRVDVTAEDEVALTEVKVKCLNNMAASQLKLDHHDAVVKSCSAALELQPENVKAMYRLGKVLSLRGEYQEANHILRRALKLEPANKTIHAELSKLAKKTAEQKGAEQELYKKMLGNHVSVTSEKKQSKKSWRLSWKWLFGATAVAIGGVALSVVFAARS